MSSSESTRRKSTARNPRERVRATRACDRCKLKKARCSGQNPCAACSRLGLPCSYDAVYTRGRPPLILSASRSDGHIDGQSPRIDGPAAARPAEQAVESRRASLFHAAHENPEITSHEHETLATGASSGRASRESPMPGHTDAQGHYIGPSSGIVSLLRAHKRLRHTVSATPNASIFTFGDAPLPAYDSSFLVLPEKTRALDLLAIYFDFAFPTHRFMHRPTAERWLNELYDPPSGAERAPGSRERAALVLVIIAQAMLYSPTGPRRTVDIQSSAKLFAASEDELSRETGNIRLTSVQARLAQCFYLLTQFRINQCWTLFGVTARLAQAIGLHRKRSSTANGGVIETETRKRTFWSAFSLDNYLGAALGRPRAFQIEDVDQDLFVPVDDTHIFVDRISWETDKKQSVMLAPLFHAKLSRVIHGALKDLYGINRMSSEAIIATIHKYTRALHEWRAEISSFLDTQWVNISLLKPPFSRQWTVLNLAYEHACILVNRPLLLGTSADAAYAGSERNESIALAGREIAQRCTEAARKIVDLVIDLCEGQRMYGAYWFTHYYAFSAIAVLYVEVIQSECEASLSVAQKCQELLSESTAQVSFAQRYGIVLDVLKNEALRRIQHRQDYMRHQHNNSQVPRGAPVPAVYPTPNSNPESSKWNHGPASATQDPTHQFGDPIAIDDVDIDGVDAALRGSPLFLFGMAGWGELDSMVSAGFEADYGPPQLPPESFNMPPVAGNMYQAGNVTGQTHPGSYFGS